MKLFKLRNGLKVIFQEVNNLDILACTIFLPGGASIEDKLKAGITVLSLKTAFKRTLKRSSLEFAKIQEQFGTPFIPDVSSDYSFIKFQIITEGLEKYIKLFQEVIEEPGFTEESFKVEKESLLAAIRSRKENSFSLAYEKMISLTYNGTPYEKLPYGEELTVKPLTLEDIRNQFKKVVVPEGTVFSFCGKIKDAEGILKLLEKIKTKKLRELQHFSKRIENIEEVEVKRKGSSQVFIILAVNAPSISEKDFLSYKLFNTLLGEGIGSLLFQELRERKGFAYSTGSIFPIRKNSGRLFFYIGTSPEKEKEVKRALISLKENLPNLITKEALNRAKQFFRGNFELDHETRMKKAWYSGLWEILGKSSSFDSQILDLVEEVSFSNLLDVAEKISFEPYHMVVVKDE
ncbi:M16 family metallopeptidase [Desulfurobacterium thermolithotrophum]|uniref:M16 family metallopeptidase n=1 Tax=Desulfurobacterium thermolithotrophum TaxID=64160 RepID=UPI0013D5B0C2|nr:pitrilysin family protein [Desulfurobacterium thermolithotrophum]